MCVHDMASSACRLSVLLLCCLLTYPSVAHLSHRPPACPALPCPPPSPAGLKMTWHPQGDYLAVQVDKWTKTKKSTHTNFELFSVRCAHGVHDVPAEQRFLCGSWAPCLGAPPPPPPPPPPGVSAGVV
jgi:hypothetical protein